MRTLPASFLVLGACLSAPTGREPGATDGPVDAIDGPVDAPVISWPPAGADIAAAGSGDVDGDGKDDLVVADVGGDAVYLLRGGGDIDPTRTTVTTATASAPLPGAARPVAIRVVAIGAARYIVVADNPTAGARVTVFDMALEQTGTANLNPSQAPALDDVISINPSTFGPDMNAVFITLPGDVYFIEGDNLDDQTPEVLFVPPTGTTFEELHAATGYVVGGNPPQPRVAVSELQRGQRADATGPGQFAWTTIRTDANVDWIAQTLGDVTGDTFPDVVAFAADGPNPAQICVLDIQLGATPACFVSLYGMNTARITLGNVSGATQTDAVLTDLRLGQAMSSVFVVSNLRVAANQVMADSASMPFNVNLPEALPAVLQLDSGPREIVLVGKNGQIVCARPTSGMSPAAPCTP